MLKNWRKARKESEEMNLLPVMNLMVILIPALMLGAAFYHLGNIATSIPDNVPASEPPKPPKDIKVTMNIAVEKDKLLVSGSGQGLDPAAITALDKDLPDIAGKRDLDRLRAHLIRIKGEYPKSDTVMLVIDPTIRYADVVAVLDTTREHKLPPAQALAGKEFAPLFPVSSLTKRLIKAPDEDEGQEPTTEEGEASP